MSDRASRLEELKKLKPAYYPDGWFDTLEKCTGLSLDSKNLTSVPPGVCDLTNLVALSLWENRLSSLPPEISRLTGLERLGVNNNQLSSLPPEISQLTGLVGLGVENNQLSSLPPEISRLTGLERLGVGKNQLSSLPPEISRLTGLALLGVGDNKLSSLPPEISQLTGLVELGVGKNQLSSLPPEIWRLTGLKYLSVYGNPIEELPPQITALTKLQYLYIESGGKINIKRAPRGITNLPCWNNTGNRDYEHIRALQLYDLVIAPVSTPRAAPPPATQPPSDPNSAPVTGDYADVMAVDFFSQPVLGSGGFGTAYKVQLRKGVVAVKVLKKDAKPGTTEYDELTKEAKMMINLRHTNIIGLYAYGCKNLKVFYVMEYADGKSIWDLIEASGALALDKTLQYSIHINAGLKYLHNRSPPVEHRDLKPENVLICGGVAKICDFGTSSARETISRTTGFQGTFHYAAPEYFDTMKGYGPMSDIYTFALVIWAMLAGKRPYDTMTYGQITAQKMQQKLPEMPPTTPGKLAALMNECWNYDARRRPTAADLEPRLADVQKNPGAAVGEKGKSVKDMNTAELVAYLKGKNVHEDFVAAIMENEVTGKDFIGFSQKDLSADPFHLSAFQAKNIMKHVDAAKST